ncbi:MAG: asparagine synthase (glutamine-hydrolyzing) [Desulfosoma sp.]
MCGICGLFDIDGAPIKRELLVAMNETLVHRGPDEEGYYLEGPLGLAHRRLSIIDLHTGRQPIANEDGSKVIVFNGEVYNFKELRPHLAARGHVFKTLTDTEVILHAFEEWGEACLEKLRGMFAFAIWDARERTLFLARDRLGKKPLYYAVMGSTFAFASEIKALMVLPHFQKDIDLHAFSDYLSLGYVPAPKTIFQAVNKLPAAHYLMCSLKGVVVREYWDLEFSPEENLSEKEWSKLLYENLLESVRLRLVSEVPLGAFLSGGIDSSLIVALMTKCSRSSVITNSIGFSVRSYDELEYAREVAQLYHTQHHEYVVSPNISHVTEKLAWHFDEPFADASAVPTFYVCQMARKTVTVCLSGDGGDENFAGYRRYLFEYLEDLVRLVIPDPIRRYCLRGLAEIYPKADWLPQPLRAKTFLGNVARDPVEGYFRSVSFMTPEMKKKLISGDVHRELKDYDTYDIFRSLLERCRGLDAVSRAQYIDFKTYLPEDILTKVDRASMANSLEVRAPLLDHKLVELAAHIPPRFKLRNRAGKYILKKVAAHHLPPSVIFRPKMGFSMPVREWLRAELRHRVQETLCDGDARSRNLLNQKVLRRLWNAHRDGLANHSQPLWALFMFELWARRHL